MQAHRGARRLRIAVLDGDDDGLVLIVDRDVIVILEFLRHQRAELEPPGEGRLEEFQEAVKIGILRALGDREVKFEIVMHFDALGIHVPRVDLFHHAADLHGVRIAAPLRAEAGGFDLDRETQFKNRDGFRQGVERVRVQLEP
ncbi:hypothetical protein D6850_03425 [Roseovarius spongiae]|uniref:Uncharacterized protein n=1 Tax=Roseovarius spongiae TaxID=2320272 RepID=A0A3A8AWB0_9RHOB|nr:hypothetical protein D6850_03425 [Roseovarius spongiae]